MSYSAVSTAAVGLALLAVAVAVAAGVLVCLRRRRLAEKLLPVFLGVLAVDILVTLVGVATAPADLQRRAERTLALASVAERAQLARSGHYTTSVVRLERLNRSLQAEIKVDGAVVRVVRGPGAGAITLRASLGPGTLAQAALDTDGRLVEIAARNGSPTSRRARRTASSGRHAS